MRSNKIYLARNNKYLKTTSFRFAVLLDFGEFFGGWGGIFLFLYFLVTVFYLFIFFDSLYISLANGIKRTALKQISLTNGTASQLD